MPVKLLILPIIASIAYLSYSPTASNNIKENDTPTFLTKSPKNTKWTNVSQSVKGEDVIDIDYFNDKLYLTTFRNTYETSADDESLANLKRTHEYKETTIRKFMPTSAGTYMINEYGRIYFLDPVLKTWSRAFESFTNKVEIFDIVISPEKEMVAGTTNGIYKSLDGGKSWEQTIEKDFVYRIVKHENDLIAYGSHTVYKSNDFGGSWMPIFENKEEVIQDFDITDKLWTAVINRPQIILPGASGPVNLYYQDFMVSNDEGRNWSNASKNIPYKGNITSFEAVGSNWFIGTDSGVFESHDEGKTWTKVIEEVKDKFYRLSKKGDRLFANLAAQGGC